jgi:hypothetical protein
MSGGVEYMARHAGDHPFPRRWGQPPANIEQRAAWIRQHVQDELPTSYQRQLTRHDIQLRNLLRQHEIEQRR